MMSPGVRVLTVLGEFKPFGLICEALDGKPLDDVADKYSYVLFDPRIFRQIGDSNASLSDLGGDHELFIRGNRIMWTVGSRVCKRFSLSSSVLMACWSRFGKMSETVLCILQVGSLTIYNASGEVVSIPIPCSTTSIWTLPFGVLLQQAAEVNFSANASFLSSSLHFGTSDVSRPRREMVLSSQTNLISQSGFENTCKGDIASFSSHLIVSDPMEEPQIIYIEDRGKVNILKDFDERTVWTSDQVPLMATYNKGKMQHSLFVAEIHYSNNEEKVSNLSDVIPTSVLQKQFLFRRIWQGKGAQAAASKVFLATDDDTSPMVCFLLQGQKKLLSVRLQSIEMDCEIVLDVKSELPWSIPAVSAVPAVVTRPGVQLGGLPYTDIVVLSPENVLFLYSGNQCLCRFMLPSGLDQSQPASGMISPQNVPFSPDLKITGLADAVEGRINVIFNNGKMFRCAMYQNPSSLLVSDCIAAMSEGLTSNFYNHFLALLWGGSHSSNLNKAEPTVDTEWGIFCRIIIQLVKKDEVFSEGTSSLKPALSWDFLKNSEYHRSYCKTTSFSWSISSVKFGARESAHGSSIEAKPNGNFSLNSELLIKILESLHAVYECLKLDKLRKWDLELLAVLLCDIAQIMGEGSYIDHYARDFPSLLKEVDMHDASISWKTPPSLFRWLETSLRHGYASADANDLPPLVCTDGSSVAGRARKVVSFYSILSGAQQIGNKLSSGVPCNLAEGSYSTCEEHIILAMVGEKFGLKELDTLPVGVSLPLRHALDRCREFPPTDWSAAAYFLLGREDMALSYVENACKSNKFKTASNVNLISVSTPYMLHLHPVTIPSTISDPMGLESTKYDDVDSADGSMNDGMEHIFNSTTQLRYGRDLRLNEIRRLLSSARTVAIQTSVNPNTSDQDLQQVQLWQLAQRTTALPFGRGAFTLATIFTLLTEAFTVPKLVLAGRLPAQQNATVNLDPNIRNVQELKSWPEFHNAVAAGLRLAPLQGKMSRTWIIYNKPEEPNAVHAGLLLALGLHGYLCVLSITDIYQYFQPDHESTRVGLMLGLAASYRGTMQPAISKALFVHVPSRHPSSFSEIELPTLLQSSALMSIGLLYEGSAHPEIMKMLLVEIGRRSSGDNVLEREGYAVSAGFALGLVALGRGQEMLGFLDSLLNRLFCYIGGKELHNEKTVLSSIEEHNRGVGQMMDGAAVNIDVTAPGAVIALALMFLKTESEAILSRINVPSTFCDLQYIRPDFIMLRVIARNLIMWSRIYPSKDWVQSQVPEIVKIGVKGLGDGDEECDVIDVEALVQAYINVVAGACISLGLRFAGTMDAHTEDLLYEYAVYFLNEIKTVSSTSGHDFPRGLSKYIDRSTLEICLHLTVLSLSVVMAGSGHLRTLRLLKFLRGRGSADGPNYGTQMTVSLATGFLFLGGGMHTFSTSNSSIAALLITLYPRLPTGPNDNRCHLQAFRHLYVLAAEARWLQTVDVDTGLPVFAPLEINIKESDQYSETSFCEVTPCILPEHSSMKSIRVCGPRYWPQVINLVQEERASLTPLLRHDPLNMGVLYVKRKVGACSYIDDPVGCQSLLSRAMHKVFGLKYPSAYDDNTDYGSIPIDQLVSTFSSDPSLIAFAQLCCDASWNSKSDADFREFCLQVLFECVSKDRPSILQVHKLFAELEKTKKDLISSGVYLSLYTTIVSMEDLFSSDPPVSSDSLCVSSLKLTLTYCESVLNGVLASSGGGCIVQSIFIGSMRKRVDDIFLRCANLQGDLRAYLSTGSWPPSHSKKRVLALTWYLEWLGMPAPSVIRRAVDRIKKCAQGPSFVPLLRLLLPTIDINALREVDRHLRPPSG